MNTNTDLQTPAIEFRNVFFSFDDHLVLKDISLTLEKGEMIFLTGTALHKKSGSVVGEGQYRNAVASGESPGSQYSRVIDVHRRPDATALRY